jgi:hypothetical protein
MNTDIIYALIALAEAVTSGVITQEEAERIKIAAGCYVPQQFAKSIQPGLNIRQQNDGVSIAPPTTPVVSYGVICE